MRVNYVLILTPIGECCSQLAEPGSAADPGAPALHACSRQPAPAPSSLEEPLQLGRGKCVGHFNKMLLAPCCPLSVPLLHPCKKNFFQYIHFAFLIPFFFFASPPIAIFLFLLTVSWLFVVSCMSYKALCLVILVCV